MIAKKKKKTTTTHAQKIFSQAIRKQTHLAPFLVAQAAARRHRNLFYDFDWATLFNPAGDTGRHRIHDCALNIRVSSSSWFRMAFVQTSKYTNNKEREAH